jgi:hypothetical protein
MERLILMPELTGTEKQGRWWRRAFNSIVLTSIEFFLAIVAVLVGVPVLLDPVMLTLVPNSIAHLLPVWTVDLWGLQFALGGGITMSGILKDDFRMEQIGVMLLASGAFVYMLALVFVLPGAWISFITYLLFVLAMIARYWVLGRLIKVTARLNRKIRESLPDKK